MVPVELFGYLQIAMANDVTFEFHCKALVFFLSDYNTFILYVLLQCVPHTSISLKFKIGTCPTFGV